MCERHLTVMEQFIHHIGLAYFQQPIRAMQFNAAKLQKQSRFKSCFKAAFLKQLQKAAQRSSSYAAFKSAAYVWIHLHVKAAQRSSSHAAVKQHAFTAQRSAAYVWTHLKLYADDTQLFYHFQLITFQKIFYSCKNTIYCNSHYLIISNQQLNRLQLILNSAARAVTKTPKFHYITPHLKSLHWLKITQRIQYKILSLTYKSLQYNKPSTISDLLTIQPTRSTRSSAVVTL